MIEMKTLKIRIVMIHLNTLRIGIVMIHLNILRIRIVLNEFIIWSAVELCNFIFHRWIFMNY